MSLRTRKLPNLFLFRREKGCIFTVFVLLLLVDYAYASVCSPFTQYLSATTASKNVSSPNYPNDYGTGRTCLWRITAPYNYFVKIEFIDFDFQYSSTCSSLVDNLEIRDGWSSSSDLIKRYCQNNKPTRNSKLYSTGRYLFIKFKSDFNSRWVDRGFNITYSAVSRVTTCSSSNTEDQNNNIVLSSLSGIIQSPNYPFNYPNNRKCTWILKLSSSSSIWNVTFTSFELYGSLYSSCSTSGDHVEIFDGLVATGTSLGRYCRNTQPPHIYSTGNKLAIVFSSDSYWTKKGFSASYSSISLSGVSGSCKTQNRENMLRVTSSGGAIASPNYPANYPNNMDCTWKITVPYGKRVKLYFVGTYRFESTRCSTDSIEIRDGSSTTSKSLGKFCGSSKPRPLITSYRYATVQFKTDSSIQYNGFYLMYEATTSFMDLPTTSFPLFTTGMQVEGYCSPYKTTTQTFYMRKTSGTITSPNYPLNYPINMNCVWKITVASGKRVKFSVESMDIGYSSYGCYNDYLEVRDGYYSYSSKLKRYCGYSTGGALYSTDRYMWVKFHSDYSNSYSKGFKATFKEVDKSSSVALIVGLVVGFTFFIAIVIAVVCCCCKKQGSAGRINRPTGVMTSTNVTTVQQRQTAPQGTYPMQHPPQSGYPQGGYPQGTWPQQPVMYAPGQTAYPPAPGAPSQTGYQAPPPAGSYPPTTQVAPPSTENNPQTAPPPAGVQPPSDSNFQPPPPYPGPPAPTAPSASAPPPTAPPQYPPQGQSYPWQQNDETKASGPVVT